MDVSIAVAKSIAQTNTRSGVLYVVEYRYIPKSTPDATGVAKAPSVNMRILFESLPSNGTDYLFNNDPGLYTGLHQELPDGKIAVTVIRGEYGTRMINLGNGQYWRIR